MSVESLAKIRALTACAGVYDEDYILKQAFIGKLFGFHDVIRELFSYAEFSCCIPLY